MDPRNPHPNPGPAEASRARWSDDPAHVDLPPHRSEAGGSRDASAGMDRVKSGAAHTLQAAAEMLRQRAEGASGQFSALTDYGRTASQALERSARFVEELDLEHVRQRMEASVRRNPGRALLVAGAVGLVLGTMIRRR